jgi:mRNA interferase RelE/StbE
VTYRLAILPGAERDLRALAPAILPRVDGRIQALAEQPRPSGARRLQGSPFWRLRVGDYRIIYTINDADQLVTIARVRHRRDAYRGL